MNQQLRLKSSKGRSFLDSSVMVATVIKRAYERCHKKWGDLDRALFGLIFLYRGFKHIFSLGQIEAATEVDERGREFLAKHKMQVGTTWGATFWANLSKESQSLYQCTMQSMKVAGGSLLSELKFNHSPTCLNPPDLIFQTNGVLSQGQQLEGRGNSIRFDAAISE